MLALPLRVDDLVVAVWEDWDLNVVAEVRTEEPVALGAGVEKDTRETEDCERGSMPLDVEAVAELIMLDMVWDDERAEVGLAVD